MYKIVYCVAKKAEMSFEVFSRYWREDHAALVSSVAKTLRAKRYVQSHACWPEVNASLQTYRGMMPGFDGITEMWWASKEDFDFATSDPAALAAGRTLVEDEGRFIDLTKSSIFVTQEHEIFNHG